MWSGCKQNSESFVFCHTIITTISNIPLDKAKDKLKKNRKKIKNISNKNQLKIVKKKRIQNSILVSTNSYTN